MQPIHPHPSGRPLRKAKASKSTFADKVLIGTAIGSGAMLGLAVPNLVTGDTWSSTFKAVLLAGTAMSVSYAVNYFAIKRGAPLTNAGYTGAGLVSALGIGIVGAGLYCATYAGLTIRDTDALRLEQHGTKLSDYVAAGSEHASKSARIAPALLAITTDLNQKRDCELRSSCISGKGNGGRGPVARTLEEKAGRADAINVQIDEAKLKRADLEIRLEAALKTYQSVLGNDQTLKDSERRQSLRKIDVSIKRLAGELKETYPLALIGAYSGELKAGATIPGNPSAGLVLSGVLANHGNALEEVLDTLEANQTDAPVFPGKTGVTDTLNYIGHFLPIAMIAGVVELVLPISLWVYTLLALSWAAYRIEPPQAAREHDDDVAMRDLLPGPEYVAAHHTNHAQRLNHEAQSNSVSQKRRVNGHAIHGDEDQPHVDHWPGT